MPNDLSASPVANTAFSHPLLNRADRFAKRANALANSVGLTQAEALTALNHLAAMQADLAQARRAECAKTAAAAEDMSRPFQAAETELLSARAAVTEALLYAVPDPEADVIGLVPHGSTSNAGLRAQPASICRAMVDLEALRPYLSASSLRAAVRAHQAATGQVDVVGVAYAILPCTAILECDVL